MPNEFIHLSQMRQNLRSSCWRRTAATSWWSSCTLGFPKKRFTPRSPALIEPSVAQTKQRGTSCPRPWSSTTPQHFKHSRNIKCPYFPLNKWGTPMLSFPLGRVLKRSLRTWLERLSSLNSGDSTTVLRTTVPSPSSAAASMRSNSTKASFSAKNQKRYRLAS